MTVNQKQNRLKKTIFLRERWKNFFLHLSQSAKGGEKIAKKKKILNVKENLCVPKGHQMWPICLFLDFLKGNKKMNNKNGSS